MTGRLIVPVVLGALALGALPAMAEPWSGDLRIPIFTAAQACGWLNRRFPGVTEKMADGGQDQIRDCVGKEQGRLNYLRLIWPSLLDITKRECLLDLAKGEMVLPYTKLLGCVQYRAQGDLVRHGPTELR